jgi:protein-L-isoaspartate(D-aspartate) O-methyltransferase
VCGRLLQGLELSGEDTLLILAGGTGYSAAIAAPLVNRVVVVEQNAQLVYQARHSVAEQGGANVSFHIGAPENGYAAQAPYSKILLDAPSAELPPLLVDQLAEGGKIASIREGADGVLEVCIYTKIGKTLFENPLFETKGQILPNFARKERFVF